VIFVACDGYAPMRIERRQYNSWSLVKYEPPRGPMRSQNTTSITLQPSALKGDITLTASKPVFKSGHEGALFELRSSGQEVSGTFTGASQESHPEVNVTGSGSSRLLTVTLSGTWTATVTLQRSVSAPGAWTDVKDYAANGTDSYTDGLDSQDVYYRLVIKAGNYTSGTVSYTMTHANGSFKGTCRIKDVTSSTSATAYVVSSLGGTDSTSLWAEGAWSSYRGFPSSVRIFEGRLWWAGLDKIWGSSSDVYDGFDADEEGDSAPISRSIGFGPVDRINWLVALQRLMAGTQGSELSIRSSGDQEPLTTTNFNIKDGSTQGSADVAAEKIDATAVFVQRSRVKVYELKYSFEPNEYISRELTLHVPTLGIPGISRIGVQRQPDTRIHLVRDDGKALVCLFNSAEDLLCWVLVETDGDIEDVVITPGGYEDNVTYIVKRTINGSTVRYRERWAYESDNLTFTTVYDDSSTTSITGLEYQDSTVVTVRDDTGAKLENVTVTDGAVTLSSAVTKAYLTQALCYLSDSYVEYSGSATSTITGLDHLEGESVVCWADGKDQGTFTVSGGAITLSESVEKAVVGLSYTAKFKSTKLAYADQQGTALSQVKRVTALGLICAYTHKQGLQYGSDFTTMYDLPQVVEGEILRDARVHEAFDERTVMFPGEYNTDSRVCLKASSPKPCTVVGAVIEMETLDA